MALQKKIVSKRGMLKFETKDTRKYRDENPICIEDDNDDDSIFNITLIPQIPKKTVCNRILSYDVGIKNLAEAIIEQFSDGSFAIMHIDRINLLLNSKNMNSKTVSVEKLSDLLIQNLHSRIHILFKEPVDLILIEKQPLFSMRMNNLSTVLKTFFHVHFLYTKNQKTPDIKFVDPRLKLGVLASSLLEKQIQTTSIDQVSDLISTQQPIKKSLQKQKIFANKYKENKMFARDQCDLIMQKYPGASSVRQKYFALKSKRDDVADAVLQAIAKFKVL